MKYRIATADERAAYAKTDAIYPLHAYLTDDAGRVMALEDLRATWGRGEGPQWELIAPKGFHFSLSLTHTLLEHTVADVKSNAKIYPLAACTPECGCGCELDA